MYVHTYACRLCSTCNDALCSGCSNRVRIMRSVYEIYFIPRIQTHKNMLQTEHNKDCCYLKVTSPSHIRVDREPSRISAIV
jgi:hypothetical protein